MLFAIGANAEAPEIDHEALDWAIEVASFAEDGHRAMRESFVSHGERGQEEAAIAERVAENLDRWQRRRGPGRFKAGVHGLPARAVAKNLRLSTEQFSKPVNTLLHQGRVRLIDKAGDEIRAYPREAQTVFLRSAP